MQTSTQPNPTIIHVTDVNGKDLSSTPVKQVAKNSILFRFCPEEFAKTFKNHLLQVQALDVRPKRSRNASSSAAPLTACTDVKANQKLSPVRKVD